MRHPLPRCLALAALAGALALPATAVGVTGTTAQAVVRLTPGCYQSGAHGLLTGRGFTPNAPWSAKLGTTHPLGRGRTDAHGRVRARFTAPTYHGTTGTRELSLSVSDSVHTARTKFSMTPLTATFAPHDGNPATLRVRWRVLGLASRRGVYVHYLQPNGKLRTTLRIGTTSDDCGALKTGPIALFPFSYTYGRWTFQVDAVRRYSAKTLPRLLIRFDIKKPPKQTQ